MARRLPRGNLFTYLSDYTYNGDGQTWYRMATTKTTHADSYGPVTSRLTAATVLQTWGGAVTGGWVVSQLVATVLGHTEGVHLGLTAFWLAGSLVPITVSFLWMRKYSLNGLFPAWTVLGVTGLAASFAVALNIVALSPVLVFGVLWFVGPAIGFGITAGYMDDWSQNLYTVAGLANVAAAGFLLTVPAFAKTYFLVAALIQGFPMLYHGIRVR